MAVHTTEHEWVAVVDGAVVAVIRTLNTEEIELQIYDEGEPTGEPLPFSRSEAGEMARRIAQCLKETKRGGRYDPDRRPPPEGSVGGVRHRDVSEGQNA